MREKKKPLITHRNVRSITFVLFGIGFLIGSLGQSEEAVMIGMVVILLGAALYFIFYRCPDCGRLLSREGGGYCPNCGRALAAPEEEPLRTMTAPAYAKLNLTLDILGRREDGYHEMKMVMQTVSLHDDVTLTLCEGTGITCRVEGAQLPCDERNLAVKAAKAFCDELGLGGSVEIALKKRIPSEAGMAGGSADAAAVLRILRDLARPTLEDAELEKIGAKVGSDVPFCIRGGTQLAEGRGEVLTVCKRAPKLYAAVCKPDFPISTPALFARVDSVTIGERPDTAAILRAIESGDAAALCAQVGNVFEQALDGAQRERIETLKRALVLHGAECAAMTGSGSAVFGLFRREDACRAACEALQSESVQTFCTEFV